MLPPRFVVMLANYVEEKLPTLASGDLTLTLSDEAVAYLSRRLTAFQVRDNRPFFEREGVPSGIAGAGHGCRVCRV